MKVIPMLSVLHHFDFPNSTWFIILDANYPYNYICFQDQEDSIPPHIKDLIKILSIPALTVFSLAEISMYCLISYELYKHDKLMTMVLRPDAIKRRMKKNATDLFSHACQFFLVLCFTIIWIVSARTLVSFTLLFPMLFHNLQQVIHVFVHIFLRSQMRNELKDIFC